ncbi:MAG: prolyl oligopeptidase family serine peptidase [Reichenbachiella sp.]
MNKTIYLITIVFFSQCGPSKNNSSQENVFEELSPAENLAWVKQNLDRVMKPKNFRANNGITMPYRLFTSPSYNDTTSLPLLIHLHGRGERGTDNTPKIYNNIPLFNGPNSIVSPNVQYKYPSIVLVPQCSDKTINEEWAKWVGNTPETPFEGLGEDGSYTMSPLPSESGAAVLQLIDHIIEKYNVDESRVYLTGLSMGGFGTWEYVGRRPDLFAAAVPMAGFSDPNTIDKIKHIPFWIFHGNIDKWNPVQSSRNMYDLLNESGADVRYTEYDSVGHTPAFHLAWQEPELLPWIFSQQKN